LKNFVLEPIVPPKEILRLRFGLLFRLSPTSWEKDAFCRSNISMNKFVVCLPAKQGAKVIPFSSPAKQKRKKILPPFLSPSHQNPGAKAGAKIIPFFGWARGFEKNIFWENNLF
jgi:hypothetical protein